MLIILYLSETFGSKEDEAPTFSYRAANLKSKFLLNDLFISENKAFLFLEPDMLLPPPKNNKSAASIRKPFASKDAELSSSYLIEMLVLLNYIPDAASNS